MYILYTLKFDDIGKDIENIIYLGARQRKEAFGSFREDKLPNSQHTQEIW